MTGLTGPTKTGLARNVLKLFTLGLGFGDSRDSGLDSSSSGSGLSDLASSGLDRKALTAFTKSLALSGSSGSFSNDLDTSVLAVIGLARNVLILLVSDLVLSGFLVSNDTDSSDLLETGLSRFVLTLLVMALLLLDGCSLSSPGNTG